MAVINEHFLLDEQHLLRCHAFLRFPWLEHGFETRHGQMPQDGFQLASLKQIHSGIVVAPPDAPGECGEGDALVTQRAGQLIAIRTADCVPVLLVDPETRAVAAIHAGWRGVVGEVIPNAIGQMRRNYETKPDALLAAIGPCIQLDAFEVGPEVAIEFRQLFPERDDLDTKCHIDLAEACRRQLLTAGLADEHIFDSEQCTLSTPELYHSYRRDGAKQAGRMQAFIGVRQTINA